jgi:hypothetical protein
MEVREQAMGVMKDNERGKRSAFKSVLGAAAMAAAAWVSPTAWAANASDLFVQLKDSQPDPEVSVSRSGLASNIVYRIFINNTGGNTVNQVVFTGNSDVGAYSAFVNIGAANPNCAAASSPVDPSVHSVTCQVGQLKAGDSREFFLLFQTPTTGTSITFTGTTTFSEGNSPNTPPANFTDTIGPKTTALITSTADQINKNVKTVLPPTGGSFFTGPNGAVSSTNQWSTLVALPTTTGAVTNNQILLPSAAPVSFACSGDFAGYFCYGLQSNIAVIKAIDNLGLFLNDNDSSFIEIKLRQDASSLAVIKPIPKIGDVKIFYNSDPTTIMGVGALVPPCTASPPTALHPCVFQRNDNLKGNKGYYEYVIHAKDNGQYNW